MSMIFFSEVGMDRAVFWRSRGNAELQGRQTPGVVSKSEKHFRSQHDTMMIAKARTKSFALSAINACALIIVSCCDRKCFSLFDTTPGAGGEKTLSDIKVTLLTEDTFFTIRIFKFPIFMCFLSKQSEKQNRQSGSRVKSSRKIQRISLFLYYVFLCHNYTVI